ncbi:MAG: endonuclease domain-containing protein [Planctomycetota bacterium]|nr:endonuclease domain-containing protein [Planctomycetota bacterium]
MRPNHSDDFAKHLRKAATPAECLLWQLVRNRQRCNAKFRRQYPFGPFILDFYCPEAKIAIECDGKPHFTAEGIEKDRLRTEWLNQQGVEVIRFTSHEIESDTQQVLSKIDFVLNKLLNRNAPPHPPTPSPPMEEKGSRSVAKIFHCE